MRPIDNLHEDLKTKREPSELLTLRPTFWGVSIDLKEAWRRFANTQTSIKELLPSPSESLELKSGTLSKSTAALRDSQSVNFSDTEVKRDTMTNSLIVRCLKSLEPVRDLPVELHKAAFWGGALHKGTTSKKGEVEIFYQKYRGPAVIYIDGYNRAELEINDDLSGEEFVFYKVDGEWWPQF